MSYAKQSLLSDESIIYYTKPHCIMFYQILIWLIPAAVIFIVTDSIFIGVNLLICILIGFFISLVNYYFSEYVITNKRVIMKVGFIRRTSLEIFLEKIEGIYIDQSMIGRVLNFGTIVVTGIGGTKNPFCYVPDPLKFRSEVQRLTQRDI